MADRVVKDTDNLVEDTDDGRLLAQARVAERPFTSQAPVVGPLIVWFRSLWNSVAAKWYVRPLLAQQNNFNRLLVERVQAQTQQAEARALQLAEQDRAQTELVRETAELTARVVQLNRALEALDARLARLEGDADA